MDNLLSLQRSFLESFQGSSSFEKAMKTNGPSSQNRLFVYHNNINQALRKALSHIYPLTWKLVGDLCANGAAYAFIHMEKSLPMTGNLEEWGSYFPNFLESFPPTKSLPYLPDFARMEWLKHEAYYEGDVPSLTVSNFMELPPDRYAHLTLKLHPTLRLFTSAYPLDQILEVVEGKVESIELETRGSHALILRSSHTTDVHWITEEYFSFFSQIEKGEPLLRTVEKLAKKNFPLQEILSFSLQNGVFSDYVFI